MGERRPKSPRNGELASARPGVRLGLRGDGDTQSLRPRDSSRLGASPEAKPPCTGPREARPGSSSPEARRQQFWRAALALPGPVAATGEREVSGEVGGGEGKEGRDERQGWRNWRPCGIPQLGAPPS